MRWEVEGGRWEVGGIRFEVKGGEVVRWGGCEVGRYKVMRSLVLWALRPIRKSKTP